MKWGVVLGVLLLSPLYVLAAGTSFFGPIVPACTEYGGAVPICQACNLVQLADNLIRFFISLAVMIASLMFAYAGFLYVTAASNKQNIDSARKIFTNVFIGLIFVLAAFLIVDMVLRVLTGSSLNILTKIECVKMETTTGSIKYTVVPGDNNVQGTQGDATGTTPATYGNPACTGAPGAATLADAMSQVKGNTSYSPGGGGMQGADSDAYGGTPYTVQQCKDEIARGAKKCSKPITVAVPQDLRDQCRLRGGNVATWDEASERFGLPQGTQYQLSDVYGCYWKDPNNKALGAKPIRYDKVTPCDIGKTADGYTLDIARCAPGREKCTVTLPNLRNIPPPKLVPGG